MESGEALVADADDGRWKAVAWVQVPIDKQSDILAVGWPILGVITVLQTAWMIIKGTKRYRGFKA